MDGNRQSGYKDIESFHGSVQWYLTESKDLISIFRFRFKIEKKMVSFNGQSITFRKWIKEI